MSKTTAKKAHGYLASPPSISSLRLDTADCTELRINYARLTGLRISFKTILDWGNNKYQIGLVHYETVGCSASERSAR